MKKFFILSLLALGGVPVLAYDFESDGIYYNITSESGLEVEVTYQRIWDTSSYGYPYRCTYTGDVIIPEYVYHNGVKYIVTGIGANAFCTSPSASLSSYMTNLKSIQLPSTIANIGQCAFYKCQAIKNLTIPSSVVKIGNDSFWCENCVSTLFLSSVPPTVNASGAVITGVANGLLHIPGEIWVPSIKAYSSWNRSIDGFWGGLVEICTPEKFAFTYNGLNPKTGWTNNINGYSMQVNDFIMQKNAGKYSVDVKVDYYKEGKLAFTAFVPYEYTISKATLIVKANNASRVYGDDNPSFTLVYSGFVNEENESEITAFPVISTTATKDSRVGEYPITISGGSAANYEFVYESGVLTVTKAPLSAKVNDTTRLYGSQNPAFTIDYYGLKNGETAPEWTTPPTFQTDATQISGVGNYVVSATNGVPINYDLAEITAGTMSITPAPLTIKANDASRQYYSEEPAFSYYCNGFVNGDDESVLSSVPVLSTTATLTSNVGTYDIKVGEVYSSNYEISFVNGTLTITPRVLTASVGNYERLYNEDNPAFEVKYEGFVGGDNESKLKSQATASTSATKTSDVGTYPIYVSGGSADNYTFSYTSGTLTINKTEQTISWEQDLIGLKVGDQVELKAVASSGLPVTYTMDNFTAAEIYSTGSKSYLDCKAGGQFLIRAVQNGDKNYYSTPRATNTVSIIGSNPPSDPSLTIKQADNGSVSIQVSKGSVYTFTVAPSNGWKVHSVTFNNTDVTNQLSSDGRYTTPAINSNSTLYVVYEQGNSAVYSAKQSDVKIQATSSGVRVIDANIGDMIRVYTTDGLLQHTVKVDGDVIDIPLTKDDVYIVKVGAKTVKLSH